jgi:hypothetical protein
VVISEVKAAVSISDIPTSMVRPSELLLGLIPGACEKVGDGLMLASSVKSSVFRTRAQAARSAARKATRLSTRI